jgi:hypothetical protein
VLSTTRSEKVHDHSHVVLDQGNCRAALPVDVDDEAADPASRSALFDNLNCSTQPGNGIHASVISLLAASAAGVHTKPEKVGC